MPNRSKNIDGLIGGRIKALRREQNISQRELAKRLYKSESTVRMWELGKSEPDLEMLKTIAEYFNVSVDYLLGKEKPAETDELLGNTIVYHRNGKSVRREFSEEQMEMLVSMIEAIPEKPKDI